MQFYNFFTQFIFNNSDCLFAHIFIIIIIIHFLAKFKCNFFLKKDAPVSPASKCTSSRVLRENLVSSLSNSREEVSIIIGDTRIVHKNEISDAIEAAKVCSRRTLQKKIALTEKLEKEDPYNLLLKNLTVTSEEEVQMGLSMLFSTGFARDTHTKDRVPVFKMPTPGYIGKEEYNSVYFCSGKPDATSLVAPLVLEIKESTGDDALLNKDLEVLLQAFERVICAFRIAGYLSRYFCLAASGGAAWLVSFHRAGMKGTLSIVRIRHRHVGILWHAITNECKKNQFYYLTNDAPKIYNAIKSIKQTPAYCRVKVVYHADNSRVYFVSFPTRFSSNDREVKKYVGVCSLKNNVNVAIKVVDEDAMFQTELHALKVVAVNANKNFYALGAGVMFLNISLQYFFFNSTRTYILYPMNYSWQSKHLGFRKLYYFFFDYQTSRLGDDSLVVHGTKYRVRRRYYYAPRGANSPQ